MTAFAYGSFDTPKSFVGAVLALDPQAAAFDCDGTLWFGDSGMNFLYWEIEEKLIPGPVADKIMRRYQEYLAGSVSEDAMCGEMVQIHRGIPERRIREFAARFAERNVVPHIFPEMRELVNSLHQRNVRVWAVSSTNNWVVEEAVKDVGIRAERVLAVRVKIENGLATDRLGDMTSGAGKARALEKVLTRKLDVSFGNSIFDLEMLELAKTPFAVNPTEALARIAQQRRWKVYQPAIAKLASPTA
jgi:HAD superfamily phosphoserine phosphatase-like hydrolase